MHIYSCYAGLSYAWLYRGVIMEDEKKERLLNSAVEEYHAPIATLRDMEDWTSAQMCEYLNLIIRRGRE